MNTYKKLLLPRVIRETLVIDVGLYGKYTLEAVANISKCFER